MDSGHSSEKPRKRTSRLPFNVNQGSSTDHLSVHQEDKKAISEPELSSKHWSVVHEGFPPGVTVEDLKKYSRRRQPNHLRPQDNLHLEDGSLKAYKTEYKRCFKAYTPAESRQQAARLERILYKKRGELHVDGSEPSDTYRVEYRESFRDYPRHRSVLKRPQNNLYPDKDQPMELVTENHSHYIRFIKAERAKLLRRSTALKPEGEMAKETEVRREYREYPSPQKAKMIRRPPSLKLEGDFENMTSEQKDKYIAYLLNQRPVLEKRHTLLKMEGDFDFQTEQNVNYVYHDHVDRPHMRKRSTSLKLDGEVEFYPEYKNNFVDFPRSRPVIYKPNSNIRYEGELEKQTETKMQFINFENAPAPETAKRDNNLHPEGHMEINPEYKENYVNFPRERPFVKKPENHLKPEGELETRTEKSEKFTEFGRQKSEIVRRPTNLKLEGELELFTEKREKFKDLDFSWRSEPVKREGNLKLEGDLDLLTEKVEKYVPNAIERDVSYRRPTNLKLEGEFYPVPEYRRSYVDFPRQRPVVRKPLENLKPSSEYLEKNTEKSISYVPHKIETPRRRRPKCNLKPEGEIEAKPEYNAKFLDFPRRRPTAKRPRENLQPTGELEKVTEKASQFISYGNVPREIAARRPENLKLEGEMEKEPEYRSSYRYPAFEVLDVKNPHKDINGNVEVSSDKSSDTSVPHHPSFRLEVYNVDEKNQGFHKGTQRIFPSEAIVTHNMKPEHEKRMAAVEAARKRGSFEKTVKSPEVPKYLTEENNNVLDSDVKSSRKGTPKNLDENSNDKSFVVLDNDMYRNDLLKTDEIQDQGRQWVPPRWMDTFTAV